MPLASNAGPGVIGRVSVFKELGLALDTPDEPSDIDTVTSSVLRSPAESSARTWDGDHPSPSRRSEHSDKRKSWYRRAFSRFSFRRTRFRSSSPTSLSPAAFPTLTHVVMLVLLFIIVLPGLRLSVPIGRARYTSSVAYGGPVERHRPAEDLDSSIRRLEVRADSPTDTCVRFSHQSTIVNGTLYIYGGQSKKSLEQKEDTWNNNFLTVPLTSSFQAGSPPIKGLSQPSGPPPVANGYLWHSLTSLFLYGGLFSDSPDQVPSPFSLWEYDIPSSSWKEHKNPKTSAGNNSEPAGRPIERAAEGAGLSVPELGRGWYFGGHLDFYTTPGWSKMVPRLYLKSFIEYTFPGAQNEGVEELEGGKTAGNEGAWRNITQGGLQSEAGFTRRADGVLVYIPGYGSEGIIINLAGGTNASFTQLNVIDVFDIATSSWYKQATSGETPTFRVNPCAVVAAANDGSSYNVHLYGGQNLIPFGDQKQYDDMWILTIPSFTWIPVKTDGQSNPPARAGHSCNVWDGQMVVVGGYVGQDLTCDSPGIYVFDLSTLRWEPQFRALTGSNPQGQQPSQQKSTGDKSHIGLSGSYGYRVPEAVRQVVGGNEVGGATVTKPVQTATQGPIATGTPALFTVTASGSIVTQTGAAGQSGGAGGKDGPNIGAIVAGVLAGVLAIVAGYFAFCAWVYRRQLALYKNHLTMSQRAGASNFGGEKGAAAGLLPRSSGGSSRPADTYPGSSHEAPTSSSGAGAATDTPPRDGIDANGSPRSSTDELMAGQEPTFLGVLLSPRRSLRVINRD
ncbi:MAG: hypothetical protein M1823_004350 [Watsoniomyces obsoletus]|nr:MAG: hypothetical protein M1823_004350 [Watsoniomyces obsoletus]